MTHIRFFGGGGTTVTPPQPPPAGGPNITFNENLRRQDAIRISLLKLEESRQRSDAIRISNLRLNETLQRGDAHRIPVVSATMTESLRKTDIATFTVGPLTAVTRSGTPDNDMWGDAGTNSALGQTNTNYGNLTPLLIRGDVTETRKAYFKINLTGFSGLTATGNVHTLTYKADNTDLIAATLRFAAQGQTGNPFTESTMTHNNAPAIPTAITRTQSLPGSSGFTLYTVTFTDAEMNQLLGKWALIVLHVTGILELNVHVLTREATAADRMTLTFKVQV